MKVSRRRRNRASKTNQKRQGVAAVEAAFCLPFVIALTLFTIEICSAIFLKETLTIAAFEGARIGVMRKSTTSDSEQRTNVILAARGVDSGTVTVVGTNSDGNTVSEIADLAALDQVTVTTRASLAGNSFFIGRYLSGNRTVSATVHMKREFDE